MRRQAISTAWAMSLFASLSAGPCLAADLIWEVENPFRFFKPTKSFALHEAAYNAARGDPKAPMPNDVIWRTERRLNDPDCKDASHPDKCAATAGKRYEQSRLGWAAQTVGETCYDSNGRPRRYSAVCERKYSWGSAKEDYVLPEAHTVAIRVAPEQLAGVTGDCVWTWQPRKAGGKAESKKLPCKDKLDDRARAALARSGEFRRDGRRQASGRPRACRSRCRRRGYFHCRAWRFLRVGREQSRPAGAVQRIARDGLRPQFRASGCGTCAHSRAELRPRGRRGSVQSEGPAAPLHGG